MAMFGALAVLIAAACILAALRSKKTKGAPKVDTLKFN
jgi:hypothetical protein